MKHKLYLENPYLRQADARIIDKKFENDLYYLKLDKTIFYPHLSGGQPRDEGQINGIPVVDVYEEDNNIIHVIKENIHSDKVRLEINWPRRIDLMQQHTGQHLLSAGFYKLFNGDTVGFHLGSDYVYVDINLAELSWEEAEKIENYVNKIITSDFEIKTSYVDLKDLDKLDLRKDTKLDSNIRIVEIDSIDFSPCAGTHLRNTGELGMIKIRKWKKYKGNIRVEFVCGKRALKDFSWKNQAINDIALLLSSKDSDVYEKVNILYNQKREAEKELRKLRSDK